MIDRSYTTDSHPEAHKPLTATEAVRLRDFYMQQNSTEGTLQEEFDKRQKEVYKSLEDSTDDSKINNPIHYQSADADLSIDAITCMRAAFGKEAVKNFCLCNALKYIYRNSSKGGDTDVAKAIWYLNKFLEFGGTSK